MRDFKVNTSYVDWTIYYQNGTVTINKVNSTI